ncbi:thioesterase-like superfamily-domain-containing protein [Xylaria palmicola]|nr:thioesterase-like superfamily-domain-containing protein [Xylaria palmicola]
MRPTMRHRPGVNLAATLRAPRPRPAISAPRCGARLAARALSSAAPAQEPRSGSGTHAAPPARWVSDVRARVGKCIGFGCDHAQIRRAASILGTLAREWRGLSAGSEGYLTGGRRGLEDQQVVWGEMDSFGHVNNATYIRYAESSRVNWILHFAVQDPKHRGAWNELMQPKTIGLIMKSIRADFKFPMTAPDTISVYHRLRTRPEATDTSLILDCVVLSHRHRRVAARTFEDVAIYDYRAAGKTVLPGFMLDVLRDTWARQEEQAERSRAKIWALLRDVEGLEKETWNREDAVEDLGAAAE